MKQEVIKDILDSVGLSYRKAAPAFNCSSGTSAGKFARGLKHLDDFIILCDYADIKITLTFPDGTTKDITKNDI